jgi:hypothetical protein
VPHAVPDENNDDDQLRAEIARRCWAAGYRPGHPLIEDIAPPAPGWKIERVIARILAVPVAGLAAAVLIAEG